MTSFDSYQDARLSALSSYDKRELEALICKRHGLNVGIRIMELAETIDYRRKSFISAQASVDRATEWVRRLRDESMTTNNNYQEEY